MKLVSMEKGGDLVRTAYHSFRWYGRYLWFWGCERVSEGGSDVTVFVENLPLVDTHHPVQAND